MVLNILRTVFRRFAQSRISYRSDQIVQMLIQSELEYLQGWRLNNFSGQPATWPVLQSKFNLGNAYWSLFHETLAHQHEDFAIHMVVRSNNKRNTSLFPCLFHFVF